MKKIISRRNMEICIVAVFVLSSMGLINFASADVASSTEGRKPNRIFDQKREEEMMRKISDKRAEIERKILEMRDLEGRLGGKIEERKMKFGSSAFATSTIGFGTSTASTSPFRIREIERIARESDKIAERFINSIERLSDSYERIQEKVKKFEKKGAVTAETKNLLDSAKSKISIASLDVETLVKTIDSGIGSQSKKEFFSLIKNLSSKAKGSIKDAQRTLSDAVNSLKPGYNKNKKGSSSSTLSSVSSAVSSNSNTSSLSSFAVSSSSSTSSSASISSSASSNSSSL